MIVLLLIIVERQRRASPSQIPPGQENYLLILFAMDGRPNKQRK